MSTIVTTRGYASKCLNVLLWIKFKKIVKPDARRQERPERAWFLEIESVRIVVIRVVSRGQTLFRAGRYRLQYKRPLSKAYTASDNALRGRGSD